MKKLPRVISIALIGTLSFAAFGTAFATWKDFNSGAFSSVCGLTSSSSLSILAQNNDVVTTEKWNLMACGVWGLLNQLDDYPRNMTPLVWGNPQNTIGGKEWSAVSGLGLGYTSVGGGFPFLGFFNGDYKYKGAFDGAGRASLGWLQFQPKDKGGDNSLRFGGFEGGIRIAPGVDAETTPNGSYLLGWERVSLSDTAGFDVDCQYRFSTNIGVRRGYYAHTVTPDFLHVAEDGGWGDDVYAPQLLEVSNTSKSVLKHMMAAGISSPSHGAAVVSLEKLCLPSYNPNNY